MDAAGAQERRAAQGRRLPAGQGAIGEGAPQPRAARTRGRPRTPATSTAHHPGRDPSHLHQRRPYVASPLSHKKQGEKGEESLRIRDNRGRNP